MEMEMYTNFYIKETGQYLGGYSVEGTFRGELESTLQLKAFANNIEVSDIEVVVEEKYDTELLETVANNLASDIKDVGQEEALEELEVNWLESSDEYCVNIGDELIFDGLTEKRAEELKVRLENRAIMIAQGGGDSNAE